MAVSSIWWWMVRCVHKERPREMNCDKLRFGGR